MRLLACFSNKPTILLPSTAPNNSLPPPPTTAPNNNINNNPTASQPTVQSQPTPNFVPTSIPELHPEYAHSEPYCFVPRTDSARVVLDRQRFANGHPPSVDRAQLLMQHGLTVVRGPSASKPPSPPPPPPPQQSKSPTSPRSPRSHVPLQVELPTTEDVTFVDSDDDLPNDENNDPCPSSPPPAPNRPSKKSFRIKTRSRQPTPSKPPSPPSPPPTTLQSSNHNPAPLPETYQYGRNPSDVPEEPAVTYEKLLQKHMDNTPAELLAPIMVPRTSLVFGDGLLESPTASQRFADAEQEAPSLLPPVTSPSSSSAPSSSNNLRARRKSKPLLNPTNSSAASSANNNPIQTPPAPLSPIPEPLPPLRDTSLPPLPDQPDPVPQRVHHRDRQMLMQIPSVNNPHSKMPRPALSRRTSSANPAKRKTVSFQDAAPVIIEPNIAAPSQSVPRSAALNKESSLVGNTLSMARDSLALSKAVVPLVDVHSDLDDDYEDDDPDDHFEDAREMPNEWMGPREHAPSEVTEHRPVPTIALAGRNSSLAVADKEAPLFNADRSASDMSAGSSTAGHSSNGIAFSRTSRRLSKRDKVGIREATKRQSMAVAEAMSEQIRGVPRSAMLAYSKNEVIIDDDDEENDPAREAAIATPASSADVDSSQDWSSGRLSVSRRRSRMKSIRVPEVIPGQVPQAPPPPPFSPQRALARSVRVGAAPPPPPPPVPPSA